MRLFHISNWGVASGQWLSCMLAGRPTFSKRAVLVRKDGSKFEALWSGQMTYDDDGLPDVVWAYVMPFV